jgi:hypothetical protein
LGAWDGPKTTAPVREEPWTYQNRPAKKIITPHYVIYSTLKRDELDQSVAQLMEGALEQYRRMSPEVTASTRPMDCYIFDNRTEWADYTRKVTGADSKVYLQITRGGYAIGDQFVAFFLGDVGTYSVAAHEGWHQYVARNFKGRIPPFLEEGIACMFENVSWASGLPRFNLSINAARTQALRHSIESKELWPLAELCTMHAGQIVHLPPERIEAFYSENWAFARFLWEGDAGKYRPAFQALLADTARGVLRDGKGGHRPIEVNWNPSIVKPTIEAYLGMKIEEIDASFQVFMRKVAYEEFRDQWQL